MAADVNVRETKMEIEWQKKQQGLRRNNDVKEIYLADRNVEAVCSFEPYVNLQKLWLSNNRLRVLPDLSRNCCLTELYLQYNLLKDVCGALGHLTLLQVLMLQGNQLTDLEKVVHELRRMQSLTVLNMFDNPLSQEKDYRHYVIFHAPSVQLLDRKEVQKAERDRSRALYDQDNEAVRDTIAFLSRSEGPPRLYYRRATVYSPTRPIKTQHAAPALSSESEPCAEDLDTAFYKRVRTKALWTYSHLDWTKAPKPSTKITADDATKSMSQPAEAEFINVTFK